jgi:hypothetical protein
VPIEVERQIVQWVRQIFGFPETASGLFAHWHVDGKPYWRKVTRKFKRFKARKVRASQSLQRLARENANLFVHWRIGMIGTLT